MRMSLDELQSLEVQLFSLVELLKCLGFYSCASREVPRVLAPTWCLRQCVIHTAAILLLNPPSKLSSRYIQHV